MFHVFSTLLTRKFLHNKAANRWRESAGVAATVALQFI